MLALILYLLHPARSVSNGFLQQQEMGSIGVLAEGEVELSNTFSEFTLSLDTVLNDIENQLNQLSDVNEIVSTSLIDSNLYELNESLMEANERIRRLQWIQAGSDPCALYSSCTECALDDACVWCIENLKCSRGDADGPMNSQCGNYVYSTCPSNSCDRFLTCNTCISSAGCGWCENGQYCLTTQDYQSGDCNPMFYFSSEAPGRDICPNSPPVATQDLYIPVAPDKLQEIQQQITSLQSKVTQIETLVQSLKVARQEIQDSVELSNQLKIQDAAISISIGSLPQKAQSLADAERQAQENDMQNLAANSTSTIIDESTAAITNDAKQIIEADTKDSQEMLAKLQQTNAEIDPAMKTVEESLDALKLLLSIKDKKEKSDKEVVKAAEKQEKMEEKITLVPIYDKKEKERQEKEAKAKAKSDEEKRKKEEEERKKVKEITPEEQKRIDEERAEELQRSVDAMQKKPLDFDKVFTGELDEVGAEVSS